MTNQGSRLRFAAETLKSGFIFLHRKIMPPSQTKIKRIGAKKLLNLEQTGELLTNAILSEEPFLASRIGSYESSIINRYLLDKYGYTNGYGKKRLVKAHSLFPKTEAVILGYAELCMKYLESIDLFATWFYICEPYLIKQYMKNAALCWLGDIEPYFMKNPWTKALAGKKVLVITAFPKSIQQQYAKRKLLFKNEVLPEFELITLKSVMVLDGVADGNFDNWFEALEHMYKETMEIDFDIALLGCGPFGFPLAGMIKNQGKQAIILGGVIQILFGIRGKRWDNIPIYKELYNEHWIYPCEQPSKKSDTLDGGCYWK